MEVRLIGTPEEIGLLIGIKNNCAETCELHIGLTREQTEAVEKNLAEIKPFAVAQSEDLTGFAAVASALRHGLDKYSVGDEITTKHAEFGEIVWRIIGINADKSIDEPNKGTVTVQAIRVIAYRQFDTPDKKHPWGWNNWENSDMRAWLNGEFLDGFTDADKAAIQQVIKRTYKSESKEIANTADKLFLLSASEVGFSPDGDRIKDEGNAYGLFVDGEYADDTDELRRMIDMDGDECYWWLRSPSPSNASFVRVVDSSGALSNSYAFSGGGLAAACVIG